MSDEEKAKKDEEKAKKDAEKATKVARDSATVVWKGKNRTYTKALHGDAVEALANEFAKKVGGTIK